MRAPSRRSTLDIRLPALVVLATAVAFWPVLSNQFVNWDDPDVLVRNAHLGNPGVLRWAFTTDLIGHYQPLAWLIWSALTSVFGLSAPAFHGLSLAAHLLNAFLVFVLALQLARAANLSEGRARIVAAVACSTFALHPLRVEPVAWASAMPYVVSLAMTLLAVIAYVNGRVALSIACYTVALLTRASAIGLPFVLLLIDFYPLDRRRGVTMGRLLREKIPFALLAAAAAIAETLTRESTTLQEVGIGARVTMAATAPFEYLGATIFPLRLTPLNALPISPAVNWAALAIGSAALVAITVGAWMLRRGWPAAIVCWLAFLALLAPVAGLTPTGIQATADRYTYVPGVVIAVLLGALIARVNSSDRPQLALAVPVVAALTFLSVLTWQQTQYWHDSIALWTRALDVDPRNDVAAYNLAIAYADAGRESDAIAWYERTLQIVPDHELARQNLAILHAAQAEREGNQLAQAGHADEAVAQYTRALALDGKRVHARAARGILLAKRGELSAAVSDLRMALESGEADPEAANVLAFALVQMGNDQEASAVLTKAVAAHPDNANLKRNLDMLSARMRAPRQ
jgi:tetratricopeptide (TPR) repeat protein